MNEYVYDHSWSMNGSFDWKTFNEITWMELTYIYKVLLLQCRLLCRHGKWLHHSFRAAQACLCHREQFHWPALSKVRQLKITTRIRYYTKPD